MSAIFIGLSLFISLNNAAVLHIPEQHYYSNIKTPFQSLLNLVTVWLMQMKFSSHVPFSVSRNGKIQSIKRQSSKQNPLKLISLYTEKREYGKFPSSVWDAIDLNCSASSYFAFRRQFVRAEWMMNLGKRSKSIGFTLTRKKEVSQT